MLLLEAVEQPLHLGLVARVEARRDPVRRPRLVDEPVLRPRRVRADRRRVDERRNARVGDRAEDARRAVDVRAAQLRQVARRLDRPRQMDDGVGAAHERRELVGRDVGARPLHLPVGARGRQPPRHAEHGIHALVPLERVEEARSDVAGGAEDDDPHRPPAARDGRDQTAQWPCALPRGRQSRRAADQAAGRRPANGAAPRVPPALAAEGRGARARRRDRGREGARPLLHASAATSPRRSSAASARTRGATTR